MKHYQINPDDLQRRLCDQLCASVRVEQRPDGELTLQADFEFPDGDRYPIYLSEAPGGVRLSDRGDTLMRISYDHDIDAFLAGSRGQLIEHSSDPDLRPHAPLATIEWRVRAAARSSSMAFRIGTRPA